MYFKKDVSITNIEDLKRECEIRSDCLGIIEEIDKADILQEVLQYFNDCCYDCDDIYEFFINDIEDFEDLLRLLFTEGYITSEQLTAIELGDFEEEDNNETITDYKYME